MDLCEEKLSLERGSDGLGYQCSSLRKWGNTNTKGSFDCLALTLYRSLDVGTRAKVELAVRSCAIMLNPA